MTRTADAPAASRAALWFAGLGGALAWTLHLLGSWLVAEFGCLWLRFHGGTPPITLLVLVAVVSLAIAVAAALAGFRSLQRLGDGGPENEVFMARTGMVASGTFAFVIAVQAVPIFFFVGTC